MNTVTLSTNHKVYLKPFLTRGAQKKIQKLTLGDSKINTKDPENIDITADSIIGLEDQTVLLMIDYITLEDEVVEANLDWLDSLPMPDFTALKTAVDEITKPKLDEKKSQ